MRWHAIALLMILLAVPVYSDDLGFEIYTQTDDGKSYGNIDARPGETVTAYLQVENFFTKRDNDYDFENIDISLTIEEFTDGDDETIDFDTFDLEPRKKKSLPFKLDIPLRIESGSHSIDLEAEAEQNDSDMTETDSFTLRIIKDPHSLYIQELTLSPSEVSCGGETDLKVEIINIGDSDEKATLLVKNEALGIDEEQGFGVEEYPDEDIYETSLPIMIKEDALSGLYPVTILLRYSGLSTEKTVDLKVRCKDSSIMQENPIDDALQDEDEILIKSGTRMIGNEQIIPSKAPAYVPVKKESDASIIAIILVIVIIILGTGLGLVMYILVRPKK